jgi:WD40 repeat protein
MKQMLKKLLVAGAITAASLPALIPAHAQEEVLWNACPTASVDSSMSGVFPRYELRNQRLLLVSWNTGEIVREVETSFLTDEFNVMNWSPDCRYMAAAVGSESPDTFIWDVTTGARMGSFPGAGVTWSPDSQQAVISDADGLKLWTVGSTSPVELTDFRGDYFLHQWTADTVFVMPYSTYYSAPGVTAFSRSTGAQTGYYDNLAGDDRQTGFTVSADGRTVILYTVRIQRPSGAGVTIWDRASGNVVQVDAGSEATLDADRLALSPDGRFLVIGGRQLRVWDLQTLPESLDARDPQSYAGPTAAIVDLRFLSNEIVQTTTGFGDVAQWNVLTGNLIES